MMTGDLTPLDTEESRVQGAGRDRLTGTPPQPGSPATGAGRPRMPHIKPYDFRRPDKFSKDHLRALERLHETFSGLAVSTLSSYLRLVVQVHLQDIRQVSYAEYLQQLALPTTLHVVAFDPSPGRIIMEITTSLVESLVDRVMGGAGRPLRRARPITEVEVTLLQNLVKALLAAYREAWSPIEDVSPRAVDMIFNPEALRSALAGDSAAVVRLEVSLTGQSHTITLCLPYSALEPFLAKLSAETPLNREQAAGSDGTQLEQHLLQVSVPVAAVLGTTRLELREIMALEVGDVVLLDRQIHQALDILIGDRPRFRGDPGLAGRKLAIRISEVAREEATHHEQQS